MAIPFLEGLYVGVGPSLSQSSEVRETTKRQCRTYHDERHCDTATVKMTEKGELVFGAEARVIYHLFELIGLSVGYRAPFNELLNGSIVLGAALLIPG